VRIQKNGQRWVTPAFVLSYEIAPLNGDHALLPNEIGFTITKKIGNAVVRNRIRRRLRHLTRALLPDLNLPGWRIVLLARHEALTRDYNDLGKDLRWAIRKLQEQRAAIKAPSDAAPAV
jgi:ribonuclease P protein component